MNNPLENPDANEATSQRLTLEEALQVAMRLHQSNQFEQAETVYRQLLEAAPDNPNILHFFGFLRHQRGYSEEGAEWIKKALNIDSEYIDAQNNLGNIYLERGEPELAEGCFRRVIELNSEFAEAYGNLGIVLKELKQFDEAIEHLLKAIAMQPNDVYLYQNLGNVYRKLENYHDAIGMYRKSLAIQPFNADAYKNLCRTFYLMGNIEECIEVVKEWLKHEPENPTALHMYASYTHTNIPPRASDEYVRQTFDGFAASFDGVLKRLDYKAPFLVQNALQQLKPDPEAWQVLDAGCGTGLCGALIRPNVKRLVGVDLSPNMLARANAREVYDDLFEAELTAFFSQAGNAYDAITCVDTFCYFGDLTEAAQSAVKALKPKGWFIFTLEKLDESEATETGFRLNLHGRYSHTESYTCQTLTEAGFNIHHIEIAVLRKEGSDLVAGLVVTAQLP
jgi:predicted TPR repeat methyltransferase